MRALGLPDCRTYLRYLTDDESGGELVQLIDAIATNVTSFFRERVHFELLGEALSGWLDRGQKSFRFWSAACSTGEEPYSMAIQLFETLKGVRAECKILATDISTRVLRTAQAGVYDRKKLDPVPPSLRRVYFTRTLTDRGEFYTVRPFVKEPILFRRLNLAHFPLPLSGPFDAIFCRNVMIYFDGTTRSRLFQEIDRLLRPGGYLMVGHAESPVGIMSNFKTVRASVYRKQ